MRGERVLRPILMTALIPSPSDAALAWVGEETKGRKWGRREGGIEGHGEGRVGGGKGKKMRRLSVVRVVSVVYSMASSTTLYEQ